jgi:glycosyltransferase involved in cell wall biosynthesis
MVLEPDFVSVVLPTFNRAELLPRSIRSILNQSHRNFELIVIDDGSTDSTETIVAGIDDARVRYIRLDCNRGQATARNLGLAAGSAELVAFQDSDDVWLPHKLSRQLDILRNDADLAGVYSDLMRCNANGARFVFKAPALVVGSFFDDRPTLYQTYGLGIQTCLFRKKALIDLGGFRDDMRCYEDLEFLLRIAYRHRLQRVPEALVEYFETPGSVSTNVNAERRAREILLGSYGRPSNTVYKTNARSCAINWLFQRKVR